jgi:hypothetical protein
MFGRHILNSRDVNATYIETDRLRVDSTSATAFTVGRDQNGSDVLTVDTESKAVSVNGSLDVTGALSFNELKSFTTEDTLIKIGNNNLADSLDLGIYAEYKNGGKRYSALYRDASDSGMWKLVDGISTEPSNVVTDTSNWSTFKTGTVTCTTALNAPSVSASTITGTLDTASQPNITAIGTQPVANITSLESLNQIILDDNTIISRAELQQLANINNNAISSTNWENLAALNQSVATSASPTFGTVTANLTGNASTATTAGTVTTASQSAITTLPNLTSVRGQVITNTAWQHVDTMNQSVATSASPSFSTLNVASPGGSGGAINSGPAGVYSYNDAFRYIRFNTNGGANDLLSAGAPMVINYNGGESGVKPENIELFGAYATSPSSLFVNGNVQLGGGAFDAIASPTRALLIRAGTSQGSATLMNITDASNASILNVSRFGITSNYATTGGGTGHLILANGGSQRFVIGMQVAETGSGNTGSDFRLFSYNDAGSYLGNPLSIKRSNSAVTLAGPLTLSSVSDNTNGNVTSGTFTPTISNLSNVTAASNVQSTYSRIGNIVTCAYYINFTPGGGGIQSVHFQFRLTLPITASSTNGAFVCGGPLGLVGYANGISTTQITCSCYSAFNIGTGGTALFVSGQYIV